jgi:hypothetical protein
LVRVLTTVAVSDATVGFEDEVRRVERRKELVGVLKEPNSIVRRTTCKTNAAPMKATNDDGLEKEGR